MPPLGVHGVVSDELPVGGFRRSKRTVRLVRLQQDRSGIFRALKFGDNYVEVESNELVGVLGLLVESAIVRPAHDDDSYLLAKNKVL